MLHIEVDRFCKETSVGLAAQGKGVTHDVLHGPCATCAEVIERPYESIRWYGGHLGQDEPFLPLEGLGHLLVPLA